MSDYGVRLTAAFLEALGQDPNVNEVGERVVWPSGGPDYTQPGHLETVIGLVRERWPVRLEIAFNLNGTCRVTIRGTGYEKLGSHTTSVGIDLPEQLVPRAAMLASLDAAGLEPPKP